MTRRSVRRWLALSAPLLIAAGCSGNASVPTPTPTADPNLTAIDGVVVGGVDAPGYTVDAPQGWSTSDGGFIVESGPSVLGLSVWDVGKVTRDPCHWKTHSSDPGPTIDDLVGALMAQPMHHAKEPRDVTLDGYQGTYLEWSVPANLEVTGDADFTGCDVEPSNGHLDFVNWYGVAGGERFQQFAGQVDRMWVLDVDGQRLLVDASYSPDTTEADRAELAGIVESLRFTDPTT